MSKKDVNNLIDLMGDDKDLRRQMVEVLKLELLGSRNQRPTHLQDVGRLRR